MFVLTCSNHTLENAERVRAVIQESPSTSIKFTKRMTWNKRRKLLMWISVESHLALLILRKELDVRWIYETHFHLFSYMHRHNFNYYSNNPMQIHNRCLHNEKVTIWCGVSTTGVIRPLLWTLNATTHVGYISDFRKDEGLGKGKEMCDFNRMVQQSTSKGKVRISFGETFQVIEVRCSCQSLFLTISHSNLNGLYASCNI
jgi:hypothetical protein